METKIDMNTPLKEAVKYIQNSQKQGYEVYFKGKGNGEVTIIEEVILIK